MMGVIQTVLAAQLVAKGDLAGLNDQGEGSRVDNLVSQVSPIKPPAQPTPSPTIRTSRGS